MQHHMNPMTDKEFLEQHQEWAGKKLIQEIRKAPDRAAAKQAIIQSGVYDQFSERKQQHIDDCVDEYHPVKESSSWSVWISNLAGIAGMIVLLYGDALLEKIPPAGEIIQGLMMALSALY